MGQRKKRIICRHPPEAPNFKPSFAQSLRESSKTEREFSPQMSLQEPSENGLAQSTLRTTKKTEWFTEIYSLPLPTESNSRLVALYCFTKLFTRKITQENLSSKISNPEASFLE